jgi:hypothetical protein
VTQQVSFGNDGVDYPASAGAIVASLNKADLKGQHASTDDMPLDFKLECSVCPDAATRMAEYHYQHRKDDNDIRFLTSCVV